MTPDDIDNLIPDDKLNHFAKEFLQEFLKDGFGAASKRSTELHVFHLLERLGGLEDRDNTALSHLLQITETRVKGYRYESKLRFAPQESKYIERRILWCIAKSKFDADAKRIKFIVEDPYVRKALAAESKRLGGVPDTSFNTEVVSLRTEQLLTLMGKLFDEKMVTNYRKDFEKLNKEDSTISFAEVRKQLVLAAASGLGGKVIKAFKVYFTGDVS